ncbi:MAG: diguanylate cyclase [Lachnospiraceae bacterium]|nr:diguanylate cyclase [Lachnospiraceae bacterium]
MQRTSIFRKFVRTTLWIVLMISLVLSCASIFLVSKLSGDDSRRLMRSEAGRETQCLDARLSQARQAVQIIYDFASERKAGNTAKVGFYGAFTQSVHGMAESIAHLTDGVQAVYMCMDPGLTLEKGENPGFFCSQTREEGEAERHSIYNMPAHLTELFGTELLDQEEARTEGIWLMPRKSAGGQGWIISYLLPWFSKEGEPVGIIGMDLDFGDTMQLTGTAELYKSGRVILADMDRKLQYTYAGETGVAEQELPAGLHNYIARMRTDDQILFYLTEEEGKQLVCTNPLINGMQLIVSVPMKAVNADRNQLMILSIVLTLVMFGLAVTIVVKRTVRIVSPLKKLTQITEQYARGDWSESYVCQTSDELQELAESIETMAKTTQSYINNLDSFAKTDSLTGLKNRNCYLEYVQKLKSQEQQVYGVAVCDINFLKTVNDSAGHEAGDELICRAARYICEIFDHSPVFRTGGDEFVVILKGRDFGNRDVLLQDFEEGQRWEREEAARSGEQPLAIAIGMAVCPTDSRDFDEVFQRADERMYENKRGIKGEMA